ncbi:hypothetical protein ACFQL4_15780 [Halosimplex aquaticum]
MREVPDADRAGRSAVAPSDDCDRDSSRERRVCDTAMDERRAEKRGEQLVDVGDHAAERARQGPVEQDRPECEPDRRVCQDRRDAESDLPAWICGHEY